MPVTAINEGLLMRDKRVLPKAFIFVVAPVPPSAISNRVLAKSEFKPIASFMALS